MVLIKEPGSAPGGKKALQAAWRLRQKARVQGLEAEVLELRQQLQVMQLDRTNQQAQLDQLSRVALRTVAADPPPPPAERTWQLDDEAAAALARLTALCLGWDAVGAMAAECKEVTPAFFADVREGLVRRMNICLQQGAEREGSEEAQQLERVVSAWVKHMGNMWTPENVALIREFSAISMARHGVSGPDPDPGSTVAAMHLSEEKQDKICSLFLDMMSRLDALFASQKALPLLFSAQMRPVPGGPHSPDLSEKVKDTQRQVEVILAEFGCEAMNTFTALEIARGYVVAHPHMFDVIQIGGYIVAQRGRAASVDEGGIEAMNDVFSWLIQEAPADAAEASSSDPSQLGTYNLPGALEPLDPFLHDPLQIAAQELARNQSVAGKVW